MSCVFQNIDPPPPSPPSECVPPRLGCGGGHTCRGERGVGGQYFGRRRTQRCTIPISNPLCYHTTNCPPLWLDASRDSRCSSAAWAAISCWADAARKETARGAALGTRWGWPATARSAFAPSATRTGTAGYAATPTVTLASATRAAVVAGDEHWQKKQQ